MCPVSLNPSVVHATVRAHLHGRWCSLIEARVFGDTVVSTYQSNLFDVSG